MKPAKPRKVIRVLKTLGFEHTRTRGSHYRFVYPDGRKVSVPVHGNKEIGRGLLRKILRDIVMTPEEVEELL